MADVTERAATTHRERLLAGLADTIRDKGFARATVADVVGRAHVSRRTFYEHFDDLVAAYLALGEALSDELFAAIADAIGSGGTLDERLDRAVGAYLHGLETDPRLMRSWAVELHLAGDRGVELQRALNERTAALLSALADDLRASDPRLAPVPLETGIMLSAGIRELALRAVDRGTPLAEVRAAAVALLLAVLRG